MLGLLLGNLIAACQSRQSPRMNSAIALVTSGHTALASCCCLWTSPPDPPLRCLRTGTSLETTAAEQPPSGRVLDAARGARACSFDNDR